MRPLRVKRFLTCVRRHFLLIQLLGLVQTFLWCLGYRNFGEGRGTTCDIGAYLYASSSGLTALSAP
jgi:hypothetical protein